MAWLAAIGHALSKLTTSDLNHTYIAVGSRRSPDRGGCPRADALAGSGPALGGRETGGFAEGSDIQMATVVTPRTKRGSAGGVGFLRRLWRTLNLLVAARAVACQHDGFWREFRDCDHGGW